MPFYTDNADATGEGTMHLEFFDEREALQSAQYGLLVELHYPESAHGEVQDEMASLDFCLPAIPALVFLARRTMQT
jgi:hypothetical protein